MKKSVRTILITAGCAAVVAVAVLLVVKSAGKAKKTKTAYVTTVIKPSEISKSEIGRASCRERV